MFLKAGAGRITPAKEQRYCVSAPDVRTSPMFFVHTVPNLVFNHLQRFSVSCLSNGLQNEVGWELSRPLTKQIWLLNIFWL